MQACEGGPGLILNVAGRAKPKKSRPADTFTLYYNVLVIVVLWIILITFIRSGATSSRK